MRWALGIFFSYFICAPGSSAKCNRWKSHSGKVHTFKHHLKDWVLGWARQPLKHTTSKREFSMTHRNRMKAASIAIKPNKSCASKEWIRKSDWICLARHGRQWQPSVFPFLWPCCRKRSTARSIESWSFIFSLALALGACNSFHLLLFDIFWFGFLPCTLQEHILYVYHIVRVYTTCISLSTWQGECWTISIGWLLHSRVWYTGYICARCALILIHAHSSAQSIVDVNIKA